MNPDLSAAERKAIPLASGVLDYFPDALAVVAEVSRVGNEQHHPGAPLHWDKSKSADEADALMRHLVDRGTIDAKDGLRHSGKVAWRALALLQRELDAEAAEGVVPSYPGQCTVNSSFPMENVRMQYADYPLNFSPIDPKADGHEEDCLPPCDCGYCDVFDEPEPWAGPSACCAECDAELETDLNAFYDYDCGSPVCPVCTDRVEGSGTGEGTALVCSWCGVAYGEHVLSCPAYA